MPFPEEGEEVRLEIKQARVLPSNQLFLQWTSQTFVLGGGGGSGGGGGGGGSGRAASSIPRGLEIAVRSMRKGEEARVTLGAAWAFGRAGMRQPPPLASVPPDAGMQYEVELVARRVESVWERGDLWEEKAKLECFLWGGAGFSSAAAAAAGEGRRAQALDVRGFVLSRLETMARWGLSEEGGIVGGGGDQ